MPMETLYQTVSPYCKSLVLNQFNLENKITNFPRNQNAHLCEISRFRTHIASALIAGLFYSELITNLRPKIILFIMPNHLVTNIELTVQSVKLHVGLMFDVSV